MPTAFILVTSSATIQLSSPKEFVCLGSGGKTLLHPIVPTHTTSLSKYVEHKLVFLENGSVYELSSQLLACDSFPLNSLACHMELCHFQYLPYIQQDHRDFSRTTVTGLQLSSHI